MYRSVYLSLIALVALAAACAPTAPRRLIPLSTASPEARLAFQRGERAMIDNDLLGSKAHFLAAIAADPNLAQAYLGLGGPSSGEERRKHVGRALELAKTLPEVERLWIEAQYAGVTGGKDALELAERVAALAPDDWRAHWFHGLIAQHHKGDLVTARRAYERATQVAPEESASYRLLAVLLLQTGDLAAAATAAERFAARAPRNPRAFAEKGNVLLRNGRLAEAEVAFREAFAIDPTLRTPGLAMVLLYRGDAAAAAAQLRAELAKVSATLANTPEDLAARYDVAIELVWTLAAAGDVTGAEAAVAGLEAVLVAAGEPMVEAQQLRAELALVRGDAAAAARLADEALAQAESGSPTARSARLTRLRVAAAAGDTALVIELDDALQRERATDKVAKTARLLAGHARRDARAVTAALDELRADPALVAEGKLLLAELLVATEAERAEQLRREVATSFGGTAQAFLHRRRADRRS
jgi:tetratricopeptide (TPR) repeat protein